MTSGYLFVGDERFMLACLVSIDALFVLPGTRDGGGAGR